MDTSPLCPRHRPFRALHRDSNAAPGAGPSIEADDASRTGQDEA
ncbi:hypothetical protein [Streptomyces althioticus]